MIANLATQIEPTISLSEAANVLWDVIVVGAGPAGSVSALQIARGGAKVLLIDKAAFPRGKVCGCCLNKNTISSLQALGLRDLLRQNSAVDLHEFRMFAGRRRAKLPLPGGVALSRLAFDSALIRRAIEAGVNFLPEVSGLSVNNDSAQLTIQLRSASARVESYSQAATKIVLAADGLAGSLLKKRSDADELQDISKVMVSATSRVGASTTICCESDFYVQGAIYMAVDSSGYVGLVRLEDGKLDIAAAFDVEQLRKLGEPRQLAKHILESCQMPVPDELQASHWRGTPALTRQRSIVAGDRLFVVGDAAGYVEPFTGEGMAWALASAIQVAPLAIEGIAAWHPGLSRRWRQAHHRLVKRRQFSCRLISGLLRSPFASQMLAATLSKMPWLATPMVRAINRSDSC